uniref:SET domain-containing protein n=1 Tax=Steinernema glaseri TaxID=37863 RepID=A0A1I8APK1_9BILA
MSARGILKDEEITVTYGRLDNSLLWFMFGFHIDNNPFNQAGIPWTFLLDYMMKDGLITPPVLTYIHENPLNPVVFAKRNGRISDGFRENVEFLLTTADSVSGSITATKEQLDARTDRAICSILRRFRSVVELKANTVLKDYEFLWRDDVGSIDAV